MKIKMMLLTAASVSLLALPALAQDNSGAGGNGGQGGQPGQAFDARKAEVVQHIGRSHRRTAKSASLRSGGYRSAVPESLPSEQGGTRGTKGRPWR